MTVLKIAGGAALSAFRLDKLNARVRAVQPGARVLAARFWHFVEVTRALESGEAATLEALLTYGAPAAAAGGREVLVTPRLGTISPWSSKATDIATHCGLGPVRRIERGTAYHLHATGDPGPILPLLHDRMTEAVLGSLDEADELFHHFPPKPLTTIDVPGGAGTRLKRPTGRSGWRWRRTRSTISSRTSPAAAGTRPTSS